MMLFTAEHISASYPRDGVLVPLLYDVSFELAEQTIYDLVGPSGAGKSTLLRVCALMLDRTDGTVRLRERESTLFTPSEWRRRVCLVPQKSSLVTGTVRDNLLLPWTLKVRAHDAPPTDATLAELLAYAELSDVELTRDASQLSGGQAARVALLRAFATRPDVLLLDEVDAALDNDSACAIGRLTKALVGPGMTCLRIRHRAADGFAAGTFTLKAGALSYAENAAVADDTACASGFDPHAYAALEGLEGAPVDGGASGLAAARSTARRDAVTPDSPARLDAEKEPTQSVQHTVAPDPTVRPDAAAQGRRV